MVKGRPKKKPSYDPDQIMKELMETISEMYLEGRDNDTSENLSLRQIADEFHFSLMKARKLLITAGVFHSEISDQVNRLNAEGKNVNQIMELTGLSRSSVQSYLPYKRIVYDAKEISVCAEGCKRYRRRKAVVRKIQKCLSAKADVETVIWNALVEFEGYPFYTAKGLKFHYDIKGNEIFVDRKKKSITRSSVNIAVQVVLENKGMITGPKQLGIFGASYIYPIFDRIGLIQ